VILSPRINTPTFWRLRLRRVWNASASFTLIFLIVHLIDYICRERSAASRRARHVCARLRPGVSFLGVLGSASSHLSYGYNTLLASVATLWDLKVQSHLRCNNEQCFSQKRVRRRWHNEQFQRTHRTPSIFFILPHVIRDHSREKRFKRCLELAIN